MESKLEIALLKIRYNGFLILYLGFCHLMAINFFLTENPYAALHSGESVRWAAAHSDTWALHVGVLLIIALLVALFATVRRLPYKPMLKISVIFFWLFISGFYTGAFWRHPLSYIFIGHTFVFISLLAIHDRRRLQNFDGGKFFLFIISSYFLGSLLSFIKPEVWGWIPFGFSRQIRGEVTLAEVFALPLILTISLLSFDKAKIKLFFLGFIFLSIIEISFFTRRTQWMLLFPLVVCVLIFIFKTFLKQKIRSRIFIWFIVIGYFLSIFICIYFILRQFDPYGLEDFLNGRMPLWQWHLELFLDNPIFGAGIFPEQPYYYTGSADSEIGVLAAFSQFGLPFGIFQISIVIVSLKNGILVLVNSESKEIERFFSYIVITMFPFWVFESSWRILNAYDLLYWYSCFYLFFISDSFDKSSCYCKKSVICD